MKIRKLVSIKNGATERRCKFDSFSVKFGEVFISPSVLKYSFNFNRVQNLQ